MPSEATDTGDSSPTPDEPFAASITSTGTGAGPHQRYQRLQAPALQYMLHPGGGDGGSRFRRDEQLLLARVQEQPGNARAWYYLGLTKAVLGDLSGAVGVLQKRVQMGGDQQQASSVQRFGCVCRLRCSNCCAECDAPTPTPCQLSGVPVRLLVGRGS